MNAVNGCCECWSTLVCGTVNTVNGCCECGYRVVGAVYLV